MTNKTAVRTYFDSEKMCITLKQSNEYKKVVLIDLETLDVKVHNIMPGTPKDAEFAASLPSEERVTKRFK